LNLDIVSDFDIRFSDLTFMDDITKQKLDMWTKKKLQLEKELGEIMIKKGEAAKEGDLRENAAYQMAVEDADTWRARLQDVEKIIANLEAEKGK
jgi:transcription elongation GreA/GreB family factor